MSRVFFENGVYEYTLSYTFPAPTGGGVLAFHPTTGEPEPMALSSDMRSWLGSSNLAAMKSGMGVPTKRQETYTVTTNPSGDATMTFGTAYSVAPNIQINPTNFSSDNQFARVTAISTTGFTVKARLRTDVAGLLPTFSNINAATIDVLITEK